MVVIWIQSVVNRTPDAPLSDSATSSTASQAVLGGTDHKLAPSRPGSTAPSEWEAAFRPHCGEHRPTRRAFPKRGVSNQQMARARLGPITPALPCRESETRRDGLADRRDCKISPTRSHKGQGGGQRAGVNPSSSGGGSIHNSGSLSSSVGRRGQGAGPPASNSHIHIAPNLATFNINPSSTWPRLACLELHHHRTTHPPPPPLSPDRSSYLSAVPCSSLLFHHTRNYCSCSTVATMREIISVNGTRTLLSPPPLLTPTETRPSFTANPLLTPAKPPPMHAQLLLSLTLY